MSILQRELKEPKMLLLDENDCSSILAETKKTSNLINEENDIKKINVIHNHFGNI